MLRGVNKEDSGKILIVTDKETEGGPSVLLEDGAVRILASWLIRHWLQNGQNRKELISKKEGVFLLPSKPKESIKV